MVWVLEVLGNNNDRTILAAKRLRGLDNDFVYRDASVKCSLNQLLKSKAAHEQDAEDVSKALYILQRHLECEICENRHNKQYFTDLLKCRSLPQKLLAFCHATEIQQIKKNGFPAMKNCNHLKINQINSYEFSFWEKIKINIGKWIQLFYRFNHTLWNSRKTHVMKLLSVEIVENRWEVEWEAISSTS